ncbi:MAG TPA: hypothetical protein VG456_22050 [Candidatus Sulfopaludibacter sp.]|jgi:hypothetical protein|nr:hypothetical protein [Candidatus Sulfopaludibacter sp.]
MALFTDGPPACIDDLSAQDSQLLNIANVEGIDVTQKLRLAHEEIGIQLYAALARSQSPEQPFWQPAGSALENVVVTPPLKLWHAYRALEMVYADAYNSQLNDRYAGRRDQFHGLAQWAHEKLVQIGIGMTPLPVAQAQPPTVSATAGGPLPDGTYYATMAWVNSSGAEGAAAAPTDVNIEANTIRVSPSAAPGGVAGWNVYVGTDPRSLIRQNSQPLALGDVWLQYVPPAFDGAKPGTGQTPTYVHPIPRVLQRG